MEKLGHTVELYEEPQVSKQFADSAELLEKIKEYDLVFSVNYFPRVSAACQKAGKKYIIWTVDSPLIAMHHTSVFNECNYIFIFDKFNYCQFRAMGVKQVFYMPLAVNAERLDKLIDNTPETELVQFDSSISFVGGLYHKNSYDAVKDKLPGYLQGYFDAAMWAQLDLFGENIFDRMLTVDILSQLSEIVDFKKKENSLSDLKLVFTSTFLGFKMAQMERIESLNRLASRFSVDLYTDEPDSQLDRVKLRGSVNYQADMPKVFNRSKINMNFTIRNIRSGIPLRIWDVLGAGGFLLTNFQAELPAYFENGRDIVYYESLDDMMSKAEYYLSHDDERQTIAQNGHNLVKKHHSYEQRLMKMFELAGVDHART
jgi:spore maturation protein CgeB